MAEILFHDRLSCHWFRGEEKRIIEQIEKINKELFDRSRLSLSDIYEKINKDIPEGMKIGWIPLCDTLYLNYDYSELKENKDYKPITLNAYLYKETPIIAIDFNRTDITYNP